MKSCILVLRSRKKPDRKNKVLFIDAFHEIKREATFSFLSNKNINSIYKAFDKFQTIDSFCYLASNEEISSNQYLLNIPLYVRKKDTRNLLPPQKTISEWANSSKSVSTSVSKLMTQIQVILNE